VRYWVDWSRLTTLVRPFATSGALLRLQKKISRQGELAGESADASRGLVRRATVEKEI